MERLTVTADGSCLGNPGPGGWAWVVDNDCWAAGGHPRTTNNLMELRAVYEILSTAQRQVPLLIQTDSSYVIGVFTIWIDDWVKSGWKTSGRKSVANRRSIEMISDLLVGRDVAWLHVKGHSGHLENELADKHAREAAVAVRQHVPVPTGRSDCLAARSSVR